MNPQAIRVEPKLYFYDLLPVPEGGPRFENLVALHLLKACHFWTDSAQGEFSLHFIRNRDGKEIDFLVSRDRKPWMLVEVKSGDIAPTRVLAEFAAPLGAALIQVVAKPGIRKTSADSRITVMSAEAFLAGLV